MVYFRENYYFMMGWKTSTKVKTGEVVLFLCNIYYIYVIIDN